MVALSFGTGDGRGPAIAGFGTGGGPSRRFAFPRASTAHLAVVPPARQAVCFSALHLRNGRRRADRAPLGDDLFFKGTQLLFVQDLAQGLAQGLAL